jgi:hypothetical protein
MPKPVQPADVRQPLSDTITADPASAAPSDRAVAEEAARIYPDTNVGRPTPEEIAAEAYKIYQGRGAGHGGDLDDWLEAERRLQTKPRT